MEVKTENGGTFDAAGNGTKGIAISGLVTGAAALVGNGLLGLFGANNRNGWGYGNGSCYGHYDHFVTEKENLWEQKYDSLLSELQKLKSEQYTDKSIIAYNKDKFEFNKDISNAIIDDRSRISALEQNNHCQKEIAALKEQFFHEKIKNLEGMICSSVALEAERRCNGDQNLFNYSNATFVPGKLVMPASSICPSVMPRYNSWTAPVTTADTTPTVTPTV